MIWLLIILLPIGTVAVDENGEGRSPDQYLKSGEQYYKATKELCALFGKDGFNIQNVASLLGKLAPLLAAVAPLFQMVSKMLPGEETPEMKLIVQGFKEMQVRFDEVGRRLDKVMATVQKVEAYGDYALIQDRIWRLDKLHLEYVNNPKNKNALSALAQACNDTATDPQVALNDIYQEIQDSNQRFDVRLLPAILNATEYDLRKLEQVATIIISNATKAAVLRQICLSVLHADNDTVVQYSADLSAKMLEKISTAFGNLMQELKENFRDKQLKTDVLELAESNKEDTHVEVAQKLKTYLDQKYSFLYWGVYVWKAMGILEKDDGISNNREFEYVSGERSVLVKTGYKFDVGLIWLPKYKGALFWSRMFNKTRAEYWCGETKKEYVYKLQVYLPQIQKQASRNNIAGLIDLHTNSENGLSLAALADDVELFSQKCTGRPGYTHYMFFSK